MKMLKHVYVSVVLILVLLSAGCGFTPDLLIIQPGSPVLILEFKGRYVRVAPYDKESNTMLDGGWIPTKEYKAWTFTPFDWEALIEKEGRSDASDNRERNR